MMLHSVDYQAHIPYWHHHGSFHTTGIVCTDAERTKKHAEGRCKFLYSCDQLPSVALSNPLSNGMQGQATHFVRYAPEQIEYAANRYINETHRLYEVLEKRLEGHEWLAADEYTIAGA